MGVFDADDGKPFVYVRTVLTQELYKKVGEYFGQHILQMQTKDDPVAQMLTKLFDTTSAQDMSTEIQELTEALALLAAQPKKEGTDDAGTTEKS